MLFLNFQVFFIHLIILEIIISKESHFHYNTLTGIPYKIYILYSPLHTLKHIVIISWPVSRVVIMVRHSYDGKCKYSSKFFCILNRFSTRTFLQHSVNNQLIFSQLGLLVELTVEFPQALNHIFPKQKF